MRVGTRVKVCNPFPVSNPLEGIIVKEEVAQDGKKRCKVQFFDESAAIWLADHELEAVK